MMKEFVAGPRGPAFARTTIFVLIWLGIVEDEVLPAVDSLPSQLCDSPHL